MSRKLKIGLAVAAVIVLALASVPFWIDAFVAREVEAGATEALGVETTLDDFTLSLFGGNADIEGIRVKNPEGYDGDFIEVRSGRVGVTYATLLDETVEIPEITLEDIELNLVQRDDGANYNVVLDHLRREPEGDEGGKTFSVARVVLKNVHVKASVGALRDVKSEMHIREIHFDIGSEEASKKLENVIRELTSKMLFAVVAHGGGILPDPIAKGVGVGLKGLDFVADAGITVITESGKTVLDGAETVLDKIGDLFDGD